MEPLARKVPRQGAESASHCRICTRSFSVFSMRFKRKCKVCSELVCDECSGHKVPVEGFEDPQRVCDICMTEEEDRLHRVRERERQAKRDAEAARAEAKAAKEHARVEADLAERRRKARAEFAARAETERQAKIDRSIARGSFTGTLPGSGNISPRAEEKTDMRVRGLSEDSSSEADHKSETTHGDYLVDGAGAGAGAGYDDDIAVGVAVEDDEHVGVAVDEVADAVSAVEVEGDGETMDDGEGVGGLQGSTTMKGEALAAVQEQFHNGELDREESERKKLEILQAPDQCAICLDDLEKGKGQALFKTECGHQFHFCCLKENVGAAGKNADKCPVCRQQMTSHPCPLPCTHPNLSLVVAGGVYPLFCPDCGASVQKMKQNRQPRGGGRRPRVLCPRCRRQTPQGATCGSCGAGLPAASELAAVIVACPTCRMQIQIPGPVFPYVTYRCPQGHHFQVSRPRNQRGGR